MTAKLVRTSYLTDFVFCCISSCEPKFPNEILTARGNQQAVAMAGLSRKITATMDLVNRISTSAFIKYKVRGLEPG